MGPDQCNRPRRRRSSPESTAVEQWLAKEGLPPDFHADRTLRYTHRRIGDTDVYFVANGAAEDCETVCAFRVSGKQPELWHPETGGEILLMQYEEKDGCTHVPLRLGPTESVFIVFRRPSCRRRNAPRCLLTLQR